MSGFPVPGADGVSVDRIRLSGSTADYVRGDGSCAELPGGGVTPNPTIGNIPYLSGAETFSDSPLVRTSATQVSSNPASDLSINVVAGQTMRLQRGGVNQITFDAAGVNINQKINTVAGAATGGNIGVDAVLNVTQLAGHNDATRTDNLISTGGGSGPGNAGDYLLVFSYIVQVVQAGATLDASVTWKDGNGNSHTKTIVTTLDLSSLANSAEGVLPLKVGNGANVVSVTTTTTSVGTALYDATLALTQIN